MTQFSRWHNFDSTEKTNGCCLIFWCLYRMITNTSTPQQAAISSHCFHRTASTAFLPPPPPHIHLQLRESYIQDSPNFSGCIFSLSIPFFVHFVHFVLAFMARTSKHDHASACAILRHVFMRRPVIMTACISLHV